MILHWSPSAPFVRKVLICAMERGIDDLVETIRTPVAPVRANPTLLAGDNPLSKVPALRLQNGASLYDSRVICEYLDQLGEQPPLIPVRGEERWRSLRRQALADGVSDIVILWRDEGMRGESASKRHIDTMRTKFDAALNQMARDMENPDSTFNIGDIATGCALSYLDFRVEEMDWRAGRPALADWYQQFEERPSAVATKLRSDKPV